MSRDIKMMEGKTEAMAIVIELMMESLIKAGVLDADSVIDAIDARIGAPKSINVDPVESAAISASLHGWADAIDLFKSDMQQARPE